MKLIKTIKNLLLGTQEESLEQQSGFQYQPDSEGINFYLNKIDFDALIKESKGNTLQKIQLTILNMLKEQGFITNSMPNGFNVPSIHIAALDDEQTEILRLPKRFTGSFIANIQGRTGHSNFRINLTAYIDGNEIPFTRKGPFLLLTQSEKYLLEPYELIALEAWEYHQNLTAENRNETANLRLISYLKEAKSHGMDINLSIFDKFEIFSPENISVTATYLPDKSLILSPNLGDGSQPEQLENRWAQLNLHAKDGVIRIDNRIVLFDEKKLAAIKELFGTKRIPSDKVADFIKTPSAFLDAALVNLEIGFSIRVMGIGKLQHMDFGELDYKKQDWFALDSLPASAKIISKLVKSTEELERFEQSLSTARQQGAERLSFAGEVIDISNEEEVNSQLKTIHDSLEKNLEILQEENIAPNISPDETQTKEQITVLIREADKINSTLLEKAATAQLSHEPDWSIYARQPFPHQSAGILWMLGLINTSIKENCDDFYRLQGALLADDMGLGKTYMSLITAAEYLNQQAHNKKPQKPMLVIAPLSLLENWEDEVEKTFKNIPFQDITVLQSDRDLNKFRIKGAERESQQLATFINENGDVNQQTIRYALHIGPEAGIHRLDIERRLVLTTYQTLRDYQFSLCQIDWGIIIFDEAQSIKNPNTLQTRAAKGLKADFKLLATGTPVENSLGDFWCLMDTAQPGLLGDWPQFRDRWIKPILEVNEENRDAVRSEIGSALRNAVGSFMLRRIKEDQLKGLPTKSIHSGINLKKSQQHVYTPDLAVYMKGQQLEAYNAELENYRHQRADGDIRGKALSVLSNLREISLHPRLREETTLINTANNEKNARQTMRESGKLTILLSLLDDIRKKGEKVILFMITKRLQRILKLWLDEIYGLNIAIINGETTAVAKKSESKSNNNEEKTRKGLIAAFEAHSGFNVLIMSPIAAGVGLTVVGANHVVHLERHWNPAKEAQASDRVYRIGQTKPVHIHLPAVLHPQFDAFDVHLDRLLSGKLMLKDAVVTTEAVSENAMMNSLGLK